MNAIEIKDLSKSFRGMYAVDHLNMVGGIVMCLISKVLLAAVFVPIYLVMSVAAKQRTWLSIILSLGAVFSAGLGAVSDLILRKTSLV